MNPLQKVALIVGAMVTLWALSGLLGAALAWLLDRLPRSRDLAPAVFIGWQEYPGREAFELYNLTADIPGHPAESTVSRETLERAGYEVPAQSPKET